MSRIFVEENGIYGMDCSNAIWASDEIHQFYHQAKVHLSDADFIIETDTELLIVEYKNAVFPGVKKPEYNPFEDKKLNTILRKYYDTLHFLTLAKKDGPKKYVLIIEAPNSDVVMRNRLKNLLVEQLPFRLQEQMNTGVRLIDDVEVLSISEWNSHERYKEYPPFSFEQF